MYQKCKPNSEPPHFFQGKTEPQFLRTPYAYRVLLPFLAAQGPTDNLPFNFGIINLFFTIAAYLLFYFYLKSLFRFKKEVYIGMVLLVFSFPTVNYSSAILTDGIGFFFFVSAIFLLQKKQIFLFSLIVAIGVLTREANLSALVVFFVYLIFAKRWGCSQHGWSIYLLTILPSILVYALVRFAFRAIPSYFWYPSIERFADNVTRPISWITVLLTILPLLGLSFFGLYQKNFQISFASTFSMHEHALLRSLLIVGILFFSYSVTSAFMSGRFIWPFYTILIPFTILCMRQTWPLNSRTISGD